jgi:16S rRNA A1518/A1519 N6-dimethyltransferase RsmA/KsgA/DIM1 with predicted DNA glycosylase/AP lyase activity
MISNTRKKETQKIIKKRKALAERCFTHPSKFIKQSHRLNKKNPLGNVKSSHSKGNKKPEKQIRPNEFIKIEEYE